MNQANQMENGMSMAPVNKNSNVQYIVEEPRQVTMATGLILFLVGFCCFPCWWVGACCLPVSSIRTKEDFTWRKVNRIMTALSIILLVVVIALYATGIAIIASQTSKSSNRASTPTTTRST
jgi:hypothetical protein